MMIGGAVVNALAFTGGNYLFSLLGRSDEAEKERKRHDLAIEALQRAESRVPAQVPAAARLLEPTASS